MLSFEISSTNKLFFNGLQANRSIENKTLRSLFIHYNMSVCSLAALNNCVNAASKHLTNKRVKRVPVKTNRTNWEHREINVTAVALILCTLLKKSVYGRKRIWARSESSCVQSVNISDNTEEHWEAKLFEVSSPRDVFDVVTKLCEGGCLSLSLSLSHLFFNRTNRSCAVPVLFTIHKWPPATTSWLCCVVASGLKDMTSCFM